MLYVVNADYFVQHIQCTREGKMDCLPTVRRLAELAFEAKERGLLAMDALVADHGRYPDPFMRKAAHLVVEISNPDQIREVLYNYILSTKKTANHQFLDEVIVAEGMLAISASADLEYIFNYLIPSLFGIEYESMVVNVYREYKKERMRRSVEL